MARDEQGRGERNRDGARTNRGAPGRDAGERERSGRDGSHRGEEREPGANYGREGGTGQGGDAEGRRFGFGSEGYLGGSAGGYGRGGALDYGRGGFDVGGRPEEWGRGDARHASGGAGSRGERGFEGGRDRYAGGAGYGGIGYGGDGVEPMERGFAGRGPKGYRRSDERIQEEVCERLTRHPGIDASDVEVRVQAGEVTLSGTVDSRRTKRMVEDVVDQCGGVVDVVNQLRIGHGTARADTSDSRNEREIPRRPSSEATPAPSTKNRSATRSGRSR